MKLFPKTFCYTLMLMIIITLIGHGLMYFLIPAFYTNQKESLAESIGEEIIQQLQQSSELSEDKVLERYAKNKAFVNLTCGDKQYVYGSFYIEDALNGNGKDYSFQASPGDQANDAQSNVTGAEQGIDGLAPYLTAQFVKREFSFQNADNEDCTLLILVTLQPVNETKGIVLEILPINLLICFIISAIVAFLYSRRLSTPIKKISETTEQMRLLKRNAVCEIRTKDEIGQLSQNINALYKQLLTSIDHLHAEIAHVSEVEQSKIDFMRAASHELKTPVSAVCTMLDSMILGVGKFEDTDTYLPVCKEKMLQLSSMIQEVLDASKLTGQPEEPIKKVQLSELLHEVCNSYRLIADSKGIVFYIETEKAGVVHIPVKAVKRAISNVISNAVNYTNSGGKVSVICSEGTIIVENECVPISEKDLNHLFEAFYRPDYSRSRETGGNGLGLYITHKLLDTYKIPYSFMPYEHGMRFTINCPTNNRFVK